MRYRALDADDDMTFGAGGANFLVNSPAAVGQAVLTRLQLARGEWFLDQTEGTPWATAIMGNNTGQSRDPAVKARILGTQGVTAILSYSSAVVERGFSVEATIDTVYGETSISAVI